jgi:hypothetical protein
MTSTIETEDVVERVWLWRNFVDGKPEYWAFDNPFPCDGTGDPMTLGEPCGWAVLKPSQNGRPDVSDVEVKTAIAATPIERLREENARLHAALFRIVREGTDLGSDYTQVKMSPAAKIANAALTPSADDDK